MSVNGITSAVQSYDNVSKSKEKPSKTQNTNASVINSDESAAAVYEKSEPIPEIRTYKPDTATVEKLKAEVDRRTDNLRNLVEKLMGKQGQVYTDATDIYAVLREGKLEVDPETRAQAQKDIAEDGYWGVEQTSERMLSFAKALAGGDPAKADEMISAVKKGFEQAKKAWGGDLPEICSKTLDQTISKLEAWRDEKSDGDKNSDMTSDALKNQAAAEKLAK